VRFREVDVSRDSAAAQEMVRRSGQMGVPVITVGDQVVVGFDARRLETLLRESAPRRASMGLSVADAAPRMGTPGAYVGRVAPSSPGARAGIQVGDVIVEANQRPIRSAADLETLAAAVTVGAHLTLVVQRDDRRMGVELVLS
jgi:S1-C subfamily serine protease